MSPYERFEECRCGELEKRAEVRECRCGKGRKQVREGKEAGAGREAGE
jgi:hypothetical protein